VATSLLGMIAFFVLLFLAALIFGSMITGSGSALFAGLMMALTMGAGMSFMWCTLAYETSQAYTTGQTSIADGLEDGGRGTFSALGAAVIGFIGFAVVLVAYTFLAGAVGEAVDGMGSGLLSTLFALVIVLGMLVLYLVAGALMFAMVPAAVVEERGAFGALLRSVELARGAVWRIAGLLVVTFIICYLPMIAVLKITGTMSTFGNAQALLLMNPRTLLLQQLLNFAVFTLTTPFLVSALVLQYYDRRVRTEALDVQMATEQLAVAG
ncbi:MAG TPA: hypothetical protein VFQ45_23050, partial [Longimicrobium sp.]|nr:hypothetical protein [Longimicrobium sp.]